MAQWRQETILKLINAYRERRFLWDNTVSEYTDRGKRIDAWKEIANEVGCDLMTVERKLKSLKTHFMSVHKAYAKRRLKADPNFGNVVKPKWFAYDALTFLIRGRASRVNREISNGEKQNPAPASNWKSQEVSTQNRDEFTVFAEHVAIRLKNITDVRARLVAQHQINNILFEAEMGKYNVQSSYNSTQIMDEPSTSNEEKEESPKDRENIWRVAEYARPGIALFMSFLLACHIFHRYNRAKTASKTVLTVKIKRASEMACMPFPDLRLAYCSALIYNN